MPQNTALPITGFTGQGAQVRFVTRSKGAIKPNLGQDLTITPKSTNKVVNEYGNLLPALIYQVYDSASGKMGYKRSNQKQIEALLTDTDPAATTGVVMPTGMKPFNILQNLRGSDSQFKGSTLTLGCLAKPSPFAGKLMEIADGSVDFDAITHYEFPGLALQYIRATSGTAPLGAPAAPTVAVVNTGGFLPVGTYYVRITAVTAAGESSGSKEAFVRTTTGSVSKVTVTTPTLAGAVTAYNVYVSNLSGGETFAGSGDFSITPLSVTSLPSASATACPNLDTTGAFVAPGDIVFAGGGPYTVTLPKAAVMIPAPAGGQMYAAIFQNGSMVANLENPATVQDFAISTDGVTFSVRSAPAAGDWWDIFTVYQP